MSHAMRKVKWCLDKSQKELKDKGSHRGLVQGKPDLEKADGFVRRQSIT